MDTRSRDNDNRIIEDPIIEEEKLNLDETYKIVKSSKKRRAFFLLPFILAAIIIVGVFYYFYSPRNGNTDLTYENYELEDEIIRFAKNLNRYFIFYDGYSYKEYGENYKLNNFLTPNYDFSQEAIEEGYAISGNSENIASEAIIVEEYRDAPSGFYENHYYDEDTDSYFTISSDAYLDNISEFDSNYYEIDNYIFNESGFTFYIRDSINGIVYSNIRSDKYGLYDINDISQEEINDYISSSLAYYELNNNIFNDIQFNGNDLKKSFIEKGLSGYIFIPTDTKNAAVWYSYQSLEERDSTASQYLFSAVISGILLFFVIGTNIKNKDEFIKSRNKVLNLYNKLPMILKLFGFLSVFIVDNVILSTRFKFYYTNYKILSSENLTRTIFLAIALILIYLSSLFTLEILKNPRKILNQPEFLFIKSMHKKFYYVRHCNNKIYKIVFYLGLIVFLCGSFFALIFFLNLMDSFQMFLTGAIYFICAFLSIYFLRIALDFARLSYYVDEMYKGNTELNIEEKGVFKDSEHNLNYIQTGFQESITKMIKSERMKTELITNVSHDLKTPLTAIINYVELLKTEGIQSPNYRDYLEILSQKSERLKFLIEDLFEASKLSSGDTTLEKQKINIVDLMRQTLGELDEKIMTSEIDFRFRTMDETIILNIDGKKMWRVFDNLLNNIIKYAQKGTRAYIDIEKSSTDVFIVFRNVSDVEITFQPNELFERFVRGDGSRTTEGSGLGLSIAQSIVNLHGGTMDISVDGDLFKVVINFKLTGLQV